MLTLPLDVRPDQVVWILRFLLLMSQIISEIATFMFELEKDVPLYIHTMLLYNCKEPHVPSFKVLIIIATLVMSKRVYTATIPFQWAPRLKKASYGYSD